MMSNYQNFSCLFACETVIVILHCIHNCIMYSLLQFKLFSTSNIIASCILPWYTLHHCVFSLLDLLLVCVNPSFQPFNALHYRHCSNITIKIENKLHVTLKLYRSNLQQFCIVWIWTHSPSAFPTLLYQPKRMQFVYKRCANMHFGIINDKKNCIYKHISRSAWQIMALRRKLLVP